MLVGCDSTPFRYTILRTWQPAKLRQLQSFNLDDRCPVIGCATPRRIAGGSDMRALGYSFTSCIDVFKRTSATSELRWRLD